MCEHEITYRATNQDGEVGEASRTVVVENVADLRSPTIQSDNASSATAVSENTATSSDSVADFVSPTENTTASSTTETANATSTPLEPTVASDLPLTGQAPNDELTGQAWQAATSTATTTSSSASITGSVF